MLEYRSSDTIEYVPICDQAVDRTIMDQARVDEYVKSLDVSKLAIRDGCTPSKFQIGRLSRKQWIHCQGKSEAERDSELVAFGVRGFSNVTRNGKAVAFKTSRSELGDRVSSETLDAFFAPELFAELAGIIQLLARLSPLAVSPST